ncbi:hypothetical protein PSACC_01299 [Paramicrosporidium saccamoebae]|uniref:Uncharacterized protein n=1 Tax=Paramicrosporidium saccamoebae TaxID=1246581 RepID=A0A2H9TM86_9FUNG|nr:hypothetical protein PSACC_01299 [Paramicrosporidium saccamoebae]
MLLRTIITLLLCFVSSARGSNRFSYELSSIPMESGSGDGRTGKRRASSWTLRAPLKKDFLAPRRHSTPEEIGYPSQSLEPRMTE